MEANIPTYCDSLVSEIVSVTEQSSEKFPVHTIYFGGGTPSIVPEKCFQKILETIEECFDLLPDPEITVEANPGTVSFDWLATIRKFGINRISFGMQTSNAEELRMLGRIHTIEETSKAVSLARRAGFRNINLDLIYGLPGQDLEIWEKSLNDGMDLIPEHISLYCLTLEKGTILANKVEKGELPVPIDDIAAEQYEFAEELLSSRGYEHYEISNWSRIENFDKGYRCLHNLQYWRNLPYLGFGTSAHGCAGGFRVANSESIEEYITLCTQINNRKFPAGPATKTIIPVSPQTEMGETMMLGLRLTNEGVGERQFQGRYGRNMEDVFEREILKLIGQELVEWNFNENKKLLLTKKGRLLGNMVFREFI